MDDGQPFRKGPSDTTRHFEQQFPELRSQSEHTGVVATIAIQLAAQSRAHVTAVARKDAAAKLMALGAESVVEAPTDAAGRFELILEASGGDVLVVAMQRVVSAIIDGAAPADLTVTDLAKSLPYSWAEQEQRLGLPHA